MELLGLEGTYDSQRESRIKRPIESLEFVVLYIGRNVELWLSESLCAELGGVSTHDDRMLKASRSSEPWRTPGQRPLGQGAYLHGKYEDDMSRHADIHTLTLVVSSRVGITDSVGR